MLMKKLYTLVFVRNGQQILLGLKKRGFGVNKWNGFGGKIEKDETVLDAAVRELFEESGVKVRKQELKNIGHLEFTFEGEQQMMDVRVFTSTVYEGTPQESEEMLPKWFDMNDIPFEDMWLDDKYWFPYMLMGKLFHGQFHYQGLDRILKYDVQELDSMEAFYKAREC